MARTTRGTAPPPAPAVDEKAEDAVDRWRENYARIPMWLCRGTDQITHAQFHILVALVALLGGRTRWYHTSYAKVAALACTDINTVHVAMAWFIEHGWVLVNGPRNWRSYKLDLDAIQTAIYHDYDDEEDE